ncbi:MAG: sporulation protein YqfD [Firmicutes bacterium]|nr:sporulation protein YqfD [Bacillota bacterium]
MRLRSVWPVIGGYVIIRAKGGRLEAFINRAVAAGVHLWRLERIAPHLLVARAAAGDFPRLARAARLHGVQLRIVQKAGLPFFLARARRRHGFIVGGALCAALLYGLSQFIWFVRVEGNERLSAEEVLAVAAGAGLRPGVLRDEVRRDIVERRLHLELPQIAWTAVNVRGAVATVRVVERTGLDVDARGPGHIVSAGDGVVERVTVIRGEALVAPGDTVRQGQPLISGLLSSGSESYDDKLARGELPYVRAEGSVRGRVWYRGYGEAPLFRTIDEDTGRVHRLLTVRIGEREWTFGSPEPPFADVRWERREGAWKRPWDVGWTLHVAHEVRRLREPVAEALAREAAMAAALAQARQQMPVGATVVQEDVQVTIDKEAGVVRASATVEAVQELGRFSPVAIGQEEG